MKWLDFEIKRSKVEVTIETKYGQEIHLENLEVTGSELKVTGNFSGRGIN